MKRKIQTPPSRKRHKEKSQIEIPLNLPEELSLEPEIPRIQEPIWTENKAKLIERYLFYFVMITKHGAYIDGFAGPQKPDKPHMWAAKLVLESEPRWLRTFYLFDKGKREIKFLQNLKNDQPVVSHRKIEVIPGDFNVELARVLETRTIKESEACFCLLDQRTFECHWETLKRLAQYKATGSKIELFYFLSNHWFIRTLNALKNMGIVKRWWGRYDWDLLYKLNGHQRKDLMVHRFKDELGYRSVKPWPIFGRKDGGATMYYMIHATDYPGAPSLMARAYKKAVFPKEPLQQLRLELGIDGSTELP